MENKELKDILMWIINHSDDEDAMSKIALASYPYSTKYKQRYPDSEVDVHI